LSFFVETRPRRDVGASQDHLVTETSRPRPHPCRLIMVILHVWLPVQLYLVDVLYQC